MFPSRVRATSSTIAAFPRYVGASQAPSPVAPARVPLPFRAHPEQGAPPAEPSRPALRPPPEGYSRSVHASPAAYPRDLRESVRANGGYSRASHPYRSAEPSVGEDKEARNARLAGERDECVRLRRSATEWTLEEALDTPHPPLWVSAERWKRNVPAENGVTLVCMHACGLNKEHWHPTMHALLERDPPESVVGAYGTGAALSKASNVVINDIWFLDDTNHGASIDLNEGRMAAPLSWLDTGKEVANFVQHVLPGLKAQDKAQWVLDWKSGAPANKVIGVGHSYGGSGLVHAAHQWPCLFSSLFLVEPMSPPALINDPAKGFPLTLGAIKRRSEWPSREAARGVRDNALFKSWNDAAFELWLSHHLVPVDPSKPDGPVTLATPTWAEAATFSDPYAPQRAWDKLPDLGMPVGFLMAENEFWMGGDDLANEMVWRPQRPRNERVMGASHLIIQEKPKETAEALARFLATLDTGDWDANV